MKAAVYDRYGRPEEILRIDEVEKPTPKDDEVLLSVRAASLNALDWHLVRGTPAFIRLMTGLSRPSTTRLGVDVAGRVEAVGANVTEFRPGDEVFGGCPGALSEFVCTKARALIARPNDVSFEDAAAIPVAALTALQGLRDKGRVRPGQKVLVNGATGGVGTFAVQIARALGAEVCGVCSTPNVELVRSLGADRVVDYTREDFTTDAARYDVVFDTVGNRPLRACRRVLTPHGLHVIAGVRMGRWIQPFPHIVRVLLLGRLSHKKAIFFAAQRRREDLAAILELMRTGKVKPMIDRVFPLSEAAQAMALLASGHARGKVVVTV